MEVTKDMINAVLGAVSELKETNLMKNLSDTADEAESPRDSLKPKDISAHKEIKFEED